MTLPGRPSCTLGHQSSTLNLHHEQGVCQRVGRRRRRSRPGPARDSGGCEELHHACWPQAVEGRTAEPDRRRASRGRAARILGRVEWRPVGEWRLHLRQAAASRDRSPHPLPDEAARSGRSRRCKPAGECRPGVFGATVDYETPDGEDHTITIVGIDKVDLDRGCVSWISPVARASSRRRSAIPSC